MKVRYFEESADSGNRLCDTAASVRDRTPDQGENIECLTDRCACDLPMTLKFAW